MCRSGFSFPETGFRNTILETEQTTEIIEDYSRKPRQRVCGGILLELLTGCYLALFNGAADLALRAIDSAYLRGQYEMLPDVLLVVNSIRNSLLDNPLSKEKRDELMWTRPQHKDLTARTRKELVTNASLRMKRMPEDIPVQELAKEKEHSRLGELYEEGKDHLHDLKKKVVGIGLHHKMNRRRKSVEHDESELQPIKEERIGVGLDPVAEDANSASSPPRSHAHLVLPPESNSSASISLNLNGEDLERRLRDVAVVEHEYPMDHKEKKSAEVKTPNGRTTEKTNINGEEKMETNNSEGVVEKMGQESEVDVKEDSPAGAFTIGGLRHMDSDDFSTIHES